MKYLLIVLLLLSIGINFGLVLSRLGWFDSEAEQAAPGSAQSAGAQAAESEPPSEPEPPSGSDPSAEPEPSSGSAPAVPPRLVKKLERMAAELQLEGERRTQFLDIQQRFFRRSIEARQRMGEAQRALRRELVSETPDRRHAEQLLRESSREQQAMEEAFLDNYFETRTLLETPEQIRRFQRFMAHVRQLRRELEHRIEERRFEERRMRDRRERRLERQRRRGQDANGQGPAGPGAPPPP